MRVALARILLMRPDALLLDEPTNHLDLESILWLERFSRASRAPGDDLARPRVHEPPRQQDRRDRRRRAHHLHGQLRLLRAQRALLEKQQEAQFARQQAMLAKEEAFIARFKARASHAAQVQSRVKKLEKIERVEPPKRRKVVEFDFRQPPRSGEDVAKLEGVRKAYGSRVIYETSTCSSAGASAGA
jgi:ATPase subunit of ABC transporter with duplicated ATPase domains